MIRIRPLGGKVLLRMVGRPAEENIGGIVVRREAKREDRREAVVGVGGGDGRIFRMTGAVVRATMEENRNDF